MPESVSPSSRIAGFHRRTLSERVAWAARLLSPESAQHLERGGGLDARVADRMSENVIGTCGLPLSVALNFRVNQRDVLVPMAVEEPSVVAAASNAARMVRLSGGFSGDATPPVMTAQIQFDGVPFPHRGAQALEAGGAEELVVHARTKADAYRPPAYWHRIADIRAAVRIPVVANGEIWTVQDALRCRELSGCERLMLGRGMVTDPGLALAIRHAVAREAADHLRVEVLPAPFVAWQNLLPLMADFWCLVCSRLERRQQAGRLKQWLNFLRRRYPEAEVAYLALRTVNDASMIDAWMASHCDRAMLLAAC